MAQGIYDVIRNSGADKRPPQYAEHDAKSALRLELIESLACWYELLLNPAERDARQNIINLLRAMQAKVAATTIARQHGESDYCLLNFLGTRTRTRFCISKPPHFSLFGNDFIFYVEVGKNRTRKKLSTTFIDSNSGNAVRPEIKVDENFITIAFSAEDEERVSLYDFLRKCGLELQINTTLYAVEYNSHPVERWLDGASRSLTQMLYEISNEEHDFFFYSNLFKVTLMQLEQSAYTAGGVPSYSGKVENAPTLQERGEAIEKAFNAYFQLPKPHLQDIQRATRADATNYSVQVLIEQSNPHELYRFGSFEVEASDKHMFSCEIQGDEVRMSVLE
ncbi:MAG: hypothetical protein ACRCWR_05935 [Saezia sp.]